MGKGTMRKWKFDSEAYCHYDKRDVLFVVVTTLLMSIPASFEPHHFAKTLFVGALATSLSFSILLAWVTRRHRKARTFSLGIIAALFIIESYVFFNFGSRLDPNILTLILQTNASEAKEFIEVYLLSLKSLGVIAVVAVCIYLFSRIKINGRITVHKPLMAKTLLVAAVVFGLVVPFVPLPFPIGNNTIVQAYTSCKFVVAKHAEVIDMERMTDNIKILRSPSSDKAPVIVLIIGESYNKHHASLYGYPLPTTPNMDKERSRGNLLVFDNAESPTNGTAYAMRYIFSLKGCRNETSDSSQYVLMPAVFRKGGYNVVYIDNQYTRSTGGSLDYSCGYFLSPAPINDACFNYRNDQLEAYDGDCVRRYSGKLLTTPKSLNIIHLMGQHFDARKRYPSEYGRFSEKDIKRKDLTVAEREKVAAYDNATLYNDHVVAEIIDRFRHSDAVIVYLSDHGEQIYDGAKHYFGRDFGTPDDAETVRNVYQIPFVVWCSDTFKHDHPGKFKAISQAVSRSVCSADVAYLLFDLADLDFNYNDQKRSVISPSFVPHKVARSIGD